MYHLFVIEKLNEQFAEFVVDNPVNISNFEFVGKRLFITYEKARDGSDSDLLVVIPLIGEVGAINTAFQTILANAIVQKEETYVKPRYDGRGPYSYKIILYSNLIEDSF